MPNNVVFTLGMYSIEVLTLDDSGSPDSKTYVVLNNQTGVYEYSAHLLVECVQVVEQSHDYLQDLDLFPERQGVLQLATKTTH